MSNDFYEALKKIEEDRKRQRKESLDILMEILMAGIVIFFMIMFIYSMFNSELLPLLKEVKLADHLLLLFILFGSMFGFASFVEGAMEPIIKRIKNKIKSKRNLEVIK